MSQSGGGRLGVLLVLLTGMGMIWMGAANPLLSQISYAVEKGKLQATSEDLAKAEEVSGAFRKVARLARPGVVHIRVAGTERELRELRERLRAQLGDQFDEERFMRRHRGMGSGSGIVLDADGHILTNNHVVRDQTGITVTLNDDREFEARLVGADPKSDLAVIRIDASNLSPLKFGDSDQMEVGDWVLAVGAPFGLKHTVTHGIVSAIGRSDIVTGRENIMYQNFIQTDAAINPGNSGGPLLNLRGEVVGVNTAIAADEDGRNAGVAFTIPSNLARRVAEQLKGGGAVARGWLGVSLSPIDRELADKLGLADSRGVMIDVLYEGGPGDAAGLQCEDVIIAAGGRSVADIRALQLAIAEVDPGASTELKIVRDGEPRTVSVRVGRQPDNVQAFTRTARAINSRRLEKLAAGVRTMQEQLPQSLLSGGGGRALAETALRLSERRGVFVVSQPASDAKLQPGELVVAVNDRTVRNVRELVQALSESAPRKPLTLRVLDARAEERLISIVPD